MFMYPPEEKRYLTLFSDPWRERISCMPTLFSEFISVRSLLTVAKLILKDKGDILTMGGVVYWLFVNVISC